MVEFDCDEMAKAYASKQYNVPVALNYIGFAIVSGNATGGQIKSLQNLPHVKYITEQRTYSIC